uniref:Reverse transcriptase zinc-binding domain-containing protein n=1 Tax=Cannabis sativa TaxID=3483 RepID=A0A803QEJ8_CANSA
MSILTQKCSTPLLMDTKIDHHLIINRDHNHKLKRLHSLKFPKPNSSTTTQNSDSDTVSASVPDEDHNNSSTIHRYTSLRDLDMAELGVNDFNCNNISIKNRLVKRAASAYLQSTAILATRNQSCFSSFWEKLKNKVMSPSYSQPNVSAFYIWPWVLAKIYKARYFSNGSFLNAELGPNPSFIWRSLWEAKSLVKMGARKAIGDGKSTLILDEPWLPGIGTNFITTYHPNLSGRTVDSLMKIEEKVWDKELLFDMFTEEESRCILSIQLSDSATMDNWFWSEEKSGFYSVSSAYKLLQQQSGAWPCSGAVSCWQNLWKMHVPAKVHHLVWRAMAGCLPTKVQLTTKHVHVDLTCPLCNVEVESISHVLLHCGFARSCRNISMVGYVGEAATDFSSWFGDLLIFQAGLGTYLVEAVSTSKMGVVTPEVAELLGSKRR